MYCGHLAKKGMAQNDCLSLSRMVSNPKKATFCLGFSFGRSPKRGNSQKLDQNLIHKDLQLPHWSGGCLFRHAIPAIPGTAIRIARGWSFKALGSFGSSHLGRRVRALKQWGIIPKFSWFMMEVSWGFHSHGGPPRAGYSWMVYDGLLKFISFPQELDIAGWFMMVYWSLFHGSSYFFNVYVRRWMEIGWSSRYGVEAWACYLGSERFGAWGIHNGETVRATNWCSQPHDRLQKMMEIWGCFLRYDETLNDTKIIQTWSFTLEKIIKF